MTDIVERLQERWSDMIKISELEAEITRLRQLLSEAEKREREARAKALEEAAQVADEHAKANCSGAGGETEAMRLGANSIASMIRALQSEER